MLIGDAPWRDREWWNENKLEWEIFQTNSRYDLFYKKAKEAFALPQKDALETFYVCVVLGFRGLYRDPAAAAMAAEALQIPRDLQTWTRETAMAIRLGMGRPPINETNTPLIGALPLNGPQMLVWGSFFALVLAVVVAIVYWLLIYNPTLRERIAGRKQRRCKSTASTQFAWNLRAAVTSLSFLPTTMSRFSFLELPSIGMPDFRA